MGWKVTKETLTCGSLGIPQTTPAPAGSFSPAIGTVTIPANTVWEVVFIYAREQSAAGFGSNPWAAYLRDSAQTTNIYAKVFVDNTGADIYRTNNESPISQTIGPFTEDKTLEAVGWTSSGARVVTGLFRLLQSYD